LPFSLTVPCAISGVARDQDVAATEHGNGKSRSEGNRAVQARSGDKPTQTYKHNSEIERAQAVAMETGLCVPEALVRLGLVSERALADAYAERLRPRFLRAARCLPVALERGNLVLAMAVTARVDGADGVTLSRRAIASIPGQASATPFRILAEDDGY
jgi:hypothetical protein